MGWVRNENEMQNGHKDEGSRGGGNIAESRGWGGGARVSMQPVAIPSIPRQGIPRGRDAGSPQLTGRGSLLASMLQIQIQNPKTNQNLRMPAGPGQGKGRTGPSREQRHATTYLRIGPLVCPRGEDGHRPLGLVSEYHRRHLASKMNGTHKGL